MFYSKILRVENAGSGKTALIYPGLGATYDKFILKLGGGLTAADLTEIRIKANDSEFFKDTGTYLDNRQAYHGIDTDTGEVVIDFTEPRMRGDASQQYAASLPANLLKKLVIEVDIAANQGQGEDFSALTCEAEYRGPTANEFILKRRQFQYYAGAAGEYDLFLPNGVSGGVIKRVWLHEGGHLSAARITVGDRIAQDYPTIASLRRVQERNDKVIQSNISVLDFVVDGNLMGVLDTSKKDSTGSPVQIGLRLTTSAAQMVVGYIDYIDPLSRLNV